MRAGADGASERPMTSKDAENPMTTRTASSVRRLSPVVIEGVTSKRRCRYRRGSPVTTPGNAVGAGRALTDGENELPPAPEPRAFSPVDGGGGALELRVGEVVSAGCSFASEAQALNALMPRTPAAPAANANFRTKDDRIATNYPLPMFKTIPPGYMSDG